MDIPVEIVSAGYAAMAAGLVGLWRMQVKSQGRCEVNEVRMAKKLDALEAYQREQLSALAATSLPLLDRALRVIRRHEKTAHQTEDETPLVNPTHSPCG